MQVNAREERELVTRAGSQPAADLERSARLRGAWTPFDGAAETLVRRLLARAGNAPVAVVLWNGRTVSTAAAPRIRARLGNRRALIRILLDPEFQLPECIVDGSLEIEGDLVELFELLLASGSEQPSLRARLAYALSRPTELVRSLRARSHAKHHYDLPSEFYRLWLDRSMTYTCAYFPTADASLEAAQDAKHELVCAKLGLRAGQHVIEAGAGWGALAIYMARTRGVTVTAYNVSPEQVALARSSAQQAGVADRVRFVEEDYRSIVGRCDAFVSVGMLEHVAPAGYAGLGRVIDRCLAPEGRALLHTIGRHRPLPPPRWTRRRIFPGGYMPTLGQLGAVLESNGFVTLDVENLRLHYAMTLEHWLARFDAAEPAVRAMFDERFVRKWRLYLASARAGFTTGWCQLFQIVFSRRDNDAIPWTRRGPGGSS